MTRSPAWCCGSRSRPRHGLAPVDRPPKPVLEWRSSLEPEQLARSAGVQRTSRLAVRLGGVPADLALEPGRLDDQLDELPDRDLPPGAEVDRLRAVVALGGEDDPFGGVIDVQELARRGAGAPDLDERIAVVPRVDALLDERRESRGRCAGRSCRPGRRGSREAGRSR